MFAGVRARVVPGAGLPRAQARVLAQKLERAGGAAAVVASADGADGDEEWTHCICDSATAAAAAAGALHVVSPQWIVQSVVTGTRLPEADFEFEAPTPAATALHQGPAEEPPPPPPPPQQQQQKQQQHQQQHGRHDLRPEGDEPSPAKRPRPDGARERPIRIATGTGGGGEGVGPPAERMSGPGAHAQHVPEEPSSATADLDARARATLGVLRSTYFAHSDVTELAGGLAAPMTHAADGGSASSQVSEGSGDEGLHTAASGSDGACGGGTDNARIKRAFEALVTSYDRIRDQYRVKAAREVIALVSGPPFGMGPDDPQFTLEHARRLGAKTRDKVAEVLRTGQLERVRRAEADPHAAVETVLRSIWGVGGATARRWREMGYTTPEAVAEAVASNSDAALRPTAQQRCGLRHFKDFARRVPRATVAALGEVVRSAAESVVGRGVEVMLLGSYMRGASESGDVDALVLLPPPPNTYAHAPPSALSDILRTLVERGVVEVEENASTKRSPGIGGGGDANGETLHSWSGAGNAPDFGWVRLDIKVASARARALAARARKAEVLL